MNTLRRRGPRSVRLFQVSPGTFQVNQADLSPAGLQLPEARSHPSPLPLIPTQGYTHTPARLVLRTALLPSCRRTWDPAWQGSWTTFALEQVHQVLVRPLSSVSLLCQKSLHPGSCLLGNWAYPLVSPAPRSHAKNVPCGKSAMCVCSGGSQRGTQLLDRVQLVPLLLTIHCNCAAVC
jgi:hypothetical protein